MASSRRLQNSVPIKIIISQSHWPTQTVGERGPVLVMDREVVYSDMTAWCWFGRAPDFSERKMKDVMTNDGIAESMPIMLNGSCMGLWIRLRPHGLDHPKAGHLRHTMQHDVNVSSQG